MSKPPAPDVGIGNSVIAPAGVILPILFASVNHKFPSGPEVIAFGLPPVVDMLYSVKAFAGLNVAEWIALDGIPLAVAVNVVESNAWPL